MTRSKTFALSLMSGLMLSAVGASAQAVDTSKPFQVAESVTIVRHDRGLHRGWHHGHHYGWREHAWRHHHDGRTVKRVITRHADGSVTRKTVRRSGDAD